MSGEAAAGDGPEPGPESRLESSRVDVVVVAAGASRRMDGRDKLDASILGRPLLAWTLDRLAAAAIVERIIVVTAAERLKDLAGASWLNPIVAKVVAGGARRQESVAAGVAALDAADDRIVLVHDGARPAVSPALVTAVAEATADHGAAIPVLAASETIKRVVNDWVVETLDRDLLGTAQTPQGIRLGLLREAWSRFPPTRGPTFTDEASLLEAARISVHALPGDPTNLKVTVPDDLDRAAAVLGRMLDPRFDPRLDPWLDRAVDDPTGPRIGFGTDLHPFGPGAPLELGGITIEGAPRLHGHSDGDVVLHALADAMLGAAGMGDLGRLFPAGPETPRGIASRTLIRSVIDRLLAGGLAARSVDITIVGARPRLGGRVDEMRDAIAELLALPIDRVDVKASTGNLDGAEGAGRAVSAHVLAVVGRISPGAAARRAGER